MLYVQFDKTATEAARVKPVGDAMLSVRLRQLGDVLGGLEERKSEPAIALLRFTTLLALGADALAPQTWERRGLDTTRGFSMAILPRGWHGRFPVGLCASTTDAAHLEAWLREKDLSSRLADGALVAGHPRGTDHASAIAKSPWLCTLASDAPYAEIIGRFGFSRDMGGFWMAASRRDSRFQVELVVALPGLPPLHAIARDPPSLAALAEVATTPWAPLHQIGVAAPLPGLAVPTASGGSAVSATARLPGLEEPPSWDEPGPCDCGIAPDECVMKRFRLTPSDGVAESAVPAAAVPAADSLRQLTASLLDLREVRVAPGGGAIRAGDRVLVAAAPESRASLQQGDYVLGRDGTARVFDGTFAPGDGGQLPILAVVPWPRSLGKNGLRAVFSFASP